MSKAATRTTRATPDTATTTALVTFLPSIHDLGRRIAALYVVHDRCDEDGVQADGFSAEHRAQDGMDIAHAQIIAAREMICAMPAVTLADAAVQIAAAVVVADQIDGAARCEHTLIQLEKKLDRLLLSALPLIAEAAGLGMDEMGWSDLAKLRAHRFEALEAVR
jgi:hypothetical protein